ncbi:ABC transporter ATP-binding protein [Azospirillum picis]|uniref:Iron complex transport system ATP-binding protein n=1 Tax=Azospirillum picis TaxID=488438 RepID=A0ABU0MJY5_9PROT|nr:iron complex transport system ATP-binding protein [Azospirillum picis]MDQ0533758.1 iron complex transport system ATP-binding protein [Azospirillum picis]
MLFKTILGLLPPLAARILVDREDAGGWAPRRRALAIGYVPQAGAGQFPFTVREMVLMGRTAHRGPFSAAGAADLDAADAALDRLGIGHLAEREWLRISGGERQLALIARPLAQAPRMLVLDEPTASLDFGNQIRVMEQVRRLADGDGLAVVFSTHHPEQAFAVADRVALLHDGRLARLGSPAEVITAEMMREVYGAEVEVLPVGATGLSVCVPRGLRRPQAPTDR